MRALATLVLAIALVAPARAAPPPGVERVTIESLATLGGARVLIDALVYKPDGPVPDGGWPVIIGLHGCAGLYANPDAREPRPSALIAMHARELAGDGYLVVLPDSFRTRGAREMCTLKPQEQWVPPSLRRLDALGALAYVATRPDAARGRVGIIGWSHGGSATLAAINSNDAAIARFRSRTGLPFFRAAVAFYPGCAATLRAGERWKPAAPVEILIGELDDWTPARLCMELGSSAKKRGDAVAVTVYANAHHAFDGPPGRLVRRTNVPNGVDPSGVTFGPNPDASAAARRRLHEFLREQLAR